MYTTSKVIIPIIFFLSILGCGSSSKDNPENKNSNAYRISLSGIVTDEVIVNAEVTVTVGSETFTTQANTSGEYEIEIESNNEDDMVTIKAKGKDDNSQGFVEFVSIAGDLKTLTESAGEDGILTSDESLNTNVTNVSTAKYVLAKKANNGEEITSKAKLEEVETSIDTNDILKLATAIKVIVDNASISLPGGATSTLTFSQDETAIDTFIEGLEISDPGLFEQTNTEILSSPELISGFKLSTLNTAYFATSASHPGYISRYGEILELNTDNTGTLISNSGEQDFTWEINSNNEIVATMTSEEFLDTYISVFDIKDSELTTEQRNQWLDENGGYTVPAKLKTLSITYTLIQDGEKLDFINAKINTYQSYPGFEIGGNQVEIADETNTNNESFQFRAYSTQDSIAFTNNEISSNKYPIQVNVSDNPLTYASGDNLADGTHTDLVTFNSDNTVTGTLYPNTSTWTINNTGQIVIVYDSEETTTITRFEKTNDGRQGWMFEFKLTDNSRLGAYNLSTEVDSTLTFTQSNLLTTDNTAWNGMINAWIASAWEGETLNIYQYFGWQFNSDGTGYLKTGNEGNGTNYYLNYPSTWKIINGNLIISRMPHGGGDSSGEQRTWIPLRNTNNGMLVFESTKSRISENDDYGYRYPPRVNLEQKLTFPELSNLLQNEDGTETEL